MKALLNLIKWAANLFVRKPTPFTFLAFVVIVFVAVIVSGHITEKNQSVLVWSLVPLLPVATILVVIWLVRSSLPPLTKGLLPPLTPHEQLFVKRLIKLELGLIPGCATHYIGKPILVSQKALLTLYNRL